MQTADRALEFVTDGMLLGLGTGRAATAFIRTLGQRVQAGLRVRGVPTSIASAKLASELGIPLVTLEEVGQLDLTVDGADEVDPQCNLIKGLGGALVREKIVAASAKRLVILVGMEKLVPVLGGHGVLPVEVLPFGEALVKRRLEQLGIRSQRRLRDGQSFISDNHNHILDCQIGPIAEPAQFARQIQEIPGVVGTGLFLGMADTVLIQDGERVQERQRRT